MSSHAERSQPAIHVVVNGGPSGVERTVVSLFAQTVMPDSVELRCHEGRAGDELMVVGQRLGIEVVMSSARDAIAESDVVVEVHAGDVLLPSHLEKLYRLAVGAGAAEALPTFYDRHGSHLVTTTVAEPGALRLRSRASDDGPRLTARCPEPTVLRGRSGRTQDRRSCEVSVIVPAYEAAATLATALGSICGQTVTPAEVVVVDDGSTDESVAVARAFEDLLPIRVVVKPRNQGPGAARRDAIATSTQQLIALLDADDYWLPDHLERLTDAYGGPGTIVTTSQLRWRPEVTEDGPHRDMGTALPDVTRQPRRILAGNFLFVGSLFDRVTYDAAGGFADRRRVEDWDLWVRMIRCGARVVTTGTPTVLYRRHDASLSAGAIGLLQHDLEFLGGLRESLSGRDARIAVRAARGRRAWLDLVRGRQLAGDGHRWAARRHYARAALRDHSLRATAPPSGSATVRALVGLVAPRRAIARR